MKKKLLDSNILYIILAGVLAVAMWFYVCVIRGEPQTRVISNVPVVFVGEDVLEQRDLRIDDEDREKTVSLEIQADASTLAELTNRTLTVRVDVSRLEHEGEQTISYDVAPPDGVASSSFSVLSRSPANVSFHVVKFITKQVPVRGILAEGCSIADGYVAQGGFRFSPDTITVSGESEQVEQVQFALVTLGVSNEKLDKTLQETRNFQLIGMDSQVLEELEVTCDSDTVDVTYEIWKEKEVPLRLRLEPGGGVSEADTQYVSWGIEPETVTVMGDPADLESLEELTVATINLADVETDIRLELTPTIPLADGLTISGGQREARVWVEVTGLMSQGYQMEKNTFRVINVPEGYVADVRTQSLAVTLRGTDEALAQASPDNIRVTVDLSEAEPNEGQFTVPARVQFDGTDGVGVMGTSHQVVVRLTKQQQLEETS